MTEEESDLRMLSQGEEEEERLQFSVCSSDCVQMTLGNTVTLYINITLH